MGLAGMVELVKDFLYRLSRQCNYDILTDVTSKEKNIFIGDSSKKSRIFVSFNSRDRRHDFGFFHWFQNKSIKIIRNMFYYLKRAVKSGLSS